MPCLRRRARILDQFSTRADMESRVITSTCQTHLNERRSQEMPSLFPHHRHKDRLRPRVWELSKWLPTSSTRWFPILWSVGRGADVFLRSRLAAVGSSTLRVSWLPWHAMAPLNLT